MSIQPLNHWHPASWQGKAAKQQASYPSPAELADVTNQLSALPPLVTSWEIEALKEQLAAAATGKGFVLQGGTARKTSQTALHQSLQTS